LITIALDAMGGDFFPDTNLEGALLAAKKLPIKIILVGEKVILEKKIKQLSDFPTDQISIHHA